MKPHYILAAVAAATTVLALAATPAPLPPSWGITGQDPEKFQAGVDTSPDGHGAKYLLNTTSDPKAWAGLYQAVQAQRYLGQRVRFRARMRTRDVGNWAGLWMRVATKDGRQVGFYNSQDKHIKGSTGWHEYSVVLDVPSDASMIVFGVIGDGKGQVWMEPLAFETVGRDVPVDTFMSEQSLPVAPTL